MKLDDINLLDRDVFAERVPHDWFTWLRANAPIYRHPEPDGPGFWVITRHSDVVAVNRDFARNSSQLQRGGVVGLEEATPAERAEQLAPSGTLLGVSDPPEHTRYRKLVNTAFTKKMINAIEEHTRKRAVEIVERALGAETMDFVHDVAAELPLEVIAEILGAPAADRHKIFDWSNRVVGSDDPEYAVSDDSARRARIEMYQYATALAEDRKHRPQDDIATKLLTAEVDGDRLSAMDYNLFFLQIAVAGNETTRNAIAHGLHALLQHPEQYTALRDEPGLGVSAAEEILRWSSPVMYFRRNVLEDYELGGQRIRTGDKVSIWYTSANRDESVFSDPFRFDIRRTPNPHISFGGGGPHFCLGASLARMEIRVFFEEFAQRVRSVEAVGPPVRLRSNWTNGLKHLPVRLSAT
jgi:cholest-4-en-3-one 26-monooxygenase